MPTKQYNKMNHEQKQAMFRQQTKRRKRPDKKPKTITASFRITPFVLCRAIDGMWAYNGDFEPNQISQIVKEVFYHGLNNLTSHLENGKISDESKAVAMEISSQIYLDELNNVTTRSNEIKNSNPENCSKNLFKQQINSAINDRKHYETNDNNTLADNEERQLMKEQTERENAEFMKKLKEGKIK